MAADILSEIAAVTRQRVAECKRLVSEAALHDTVQSMGINPGFGLEAALRGEADIAFICEVKKASPSKGIIARDYRYLEIALEYEAAGAAAISVLTEPYYFLGDDRHLLDIASAVTLPLLRKDFVVDSYMIYQAAALGASAVLLIVSLLDSSALVEYMGVASELGLSALVEVHDQSELETALAASARIIGVNNRDLSSFEVDMRNSLRLRELVPADVLFVAESGINSSADVEAMRQAGVDAVLVGEALMRAADKRAKLDELRGQQSGSSDG